MADADDVRRLALGLPHVEEIDSDGFDFRVAGKGFIWSYPERRPGQPRLIRTDVAVLYVGDEAEKQALLLGEPEVFFTTPGYDGWPLVMLRLAEVDVNRLAELVTDAWRMRAPETLASELDGSGGPSGLSRLLTAPGGRLTLRRGDAQAFALGQAARARYEPLKIPGMRSSWGTTTSVTVPRSAHRRRLRQGRRMDRNNRSLRYCRNPG